MDLTNMDSNEETDDKVSAASSEKESSLHHIVLKHSNDASPSRSSPDIRCTICLSNLENKSFTNSCLHQFCFKCLLQWSKVKAECPLCKQPFTSIIHNVRSVEDYDQYEISDGTLDNQTVKELRRQRAYEQLLDFHNFRHAVYRGLNARHPMWNRPTTSDFRLSLYENGEWVRIHGDGAPTRYCESSPEFYHQNPGYTYRLVPWLNRELIALLRNSDTQVGVVLELILSLILRYAIKSQEFYERIHPYLHDKTSHFIHEFYNFARSFYDMVMYDEYAQYDRLENIQSTSNTSSPNSIIEVPIIDFVDKSKIQSEIRKSPQHVTGLEMIETPEHTGTFEDLAVAGPSGTHNRTELSIGNHDALNDDDCIILDGEKSKSPHVIDLCKSDDEVDVRNKCFDVQSLKRIYSNFVDGYSSDSFDDEETSTDSSQSKVKIKSFIGAVCNMQFTHTSHHSHKKRKKYKKHKSHKHPH